jgi:septum formation protein
MAVEPTIILASASPRRVELMNNLGLEFSVLPADIEEIAERAQTPREVVAELAMKKAERSHQIYLEGVPSGVAEQHAPYVVLAADTLVIFGDEILGKPTDRDDAIGMLERMSGKYHQVFTGVHIIAVNCGQEGVPEERHLQDVGISSVKFRTLTRAEIESYVDTKEPMDKAGSYALQGIGAFLLESMEGCPTNIIGLPIPLTMAMLRDCGVKIMGL